MKLISKKVIPGLDDQLLVSGKFYQRMYKIFAFLFFLACISPLTSGASPSLKEAIQDTDYLFLIDGGGSKTILQVVNNKKEVLDLEYKKQNTHSILSGPTNINVVGLENVKKNLIELFEEIKIGLEKKELSEVVNRSAIVCGIAGLASNADLESTIRALFTSFGFSESRIALFSDVILAKHLIRDEGAILISGTGSICFAKSSKGEKRIGGYGYTLGDEGSGFYIGKLALQAAFQGEFEHEPFAITKEICSQFDVTSADQIIKPFYTGKINASDIAKIAPLVFKAAYAQQDKRCHDIINTNAKALAALVMRAVKETTCPDFPVYLIGGIFKNENAQDFVRIIQENVTYAPRVNFINVAQKNFALEVVISKG